MEQTVIVSSIEEVKTYEVSKEVYLKIKEELKKEAKELRDLKHEFKNGQRGTNKGKRVWENDVQKAKWEWRHKHIAYCMLKGRTYEQIEGKCSEDNRPNMQLVEKFRQGFINA